MTSHAWPRPAPSSPALRAPTTIAEGEPNLPPHLRQLWTLIQDMSSGSPPRADITAIAVTRVRRRIRQLGRLQVRLRRASAALADDLRLLREMESHD